MTQEDYVRRHICEIGKLVWERGFSPSNAGNLCVRISDYEYLATPHGICKGFMTPDMILKIRYDPDKPDKERITVVDKLSHYDVTSEIKVHVLAIHSIEGKKASIHSHPPFCQLFAHVGLDKGKVTLPDDHAGPKLIPIAPYTTAGTWELAQAAVDTLQKSWGKMAVIMGKHGLLTVADDLETAYMSHENIEHAAKLAYLLHTYEAASKVLGS